MGLAELTSTMDPATGFPFFLISDNPGAIKYANYVRELCLVIGFMFAAATLRVFRKVKTPGTAHRGFRWRVFAICVAAVYVCGTEYQRIGEPVTFRLPLAVVFLASAFYSMWIPLPQDNDVETRLKEKFLDE